MTGLELLLVKGLIGLIKTGAIKGMLVTTGKVAAAQIGGGTSFGSVAVAAGGSLLVVGTVCGGIMLTDSIISNGKKFVNSVSTKDYEGAAVYAFEILKEGGTACDVLDILEVAIDHSNLNYDCKEIAKQSAKQLSDEFIAAGINGTDMGSHKKTLAKRIGKELTKQAVKRV